MMDPMFFETPADLRRWLERNHQAADELIVGLHRKSTGRPSITWPQLVDELLCFGWIDGVRRSIDDVSYTIRITPRRARSTWSAVNLRRMNELIQSGAMTPAGLAAWEARHESDTRRYSFEQRKVELPREHESEFRANPDAWAFFQSQPPSYRRTATWWVISAKREDTRRRRLATLIDDSANGLRLAQFRR